MQDNIHDITHSKLYEETRDEILTGAQQPNTAQIWPGPL